MNTALPHKHKTPSARGQPPTALQPIGGCSVSNDNTKAQKAETAHRVTLMHNERRRYGYALSDSDRQWLVSIHNICTQTDCNCGHYHVFEKKS